MKAEQNGTLCVFGCYVDTELYTRNRTLIDALSRLFQSTIEVRPSSRLKRTFEHGKGRALSGLLGSAWFYLKAFFSLAGQAGDVRRASVIYIPYPAYVDSFFLKLILLGRPKPRLIVDAFLCLHDTLVHDRRMISSGGLLAKAVHWLELQTLRNADLVFIDTPQQRDQLLRSYALPAGRLVVTPVGIDEAVWSPLPPLPLEENFQLLFWGTFIPLHGVETIFEAAKYLQLTHPRIKLKIIGDGQTADAAEARLCSLHLDNLEWDRRLVGSEELRENVQASHCILGIFGSSDKAASVVPYKVYQAMASNKIVITRSGPAMNELTRVAGDTAGLLLVEPGDARALATAIADVYEHYGNLGTAVQTRRLYDLAMSNAVLQAAVADALSLVLPGTK